MSFFLNSEPGPLSGRDRNGTVVRTCRRVGAGRGCGRWGLFHLPAMERKRPADLLQPMPDWETNPVPHPQRAPILFPFPGRLRDGPKPASANGQDVPTPLNDSPSSTPFHGCTPRDPWRVSGMVAATSDHARSSGTFDLPNRFSGRGRKLALGLRPPLTVNVLAVSRIASHWMRKWLNRRHGPLPFSGLAINPYFRLPGVTDADVGGHVLLANLNKVLSRMKQTCRQASFEGTLFPARSTSVRPRPIGRPALDYVCLTM